MRIPMNQSNECKQHTLSCIHQMPVSKLRFTNQIITHHTIRSSATRMEKSQLKHINCRQKTHQQNLAENLFLKNRVS